MNNESCRKAFENTMSDANGMMIDFSYGEIMDGNWCYGHSTIQYMFIGFQAAYNLRPVLTVEEIAEIRKAILKEADVGTPSEQLYLKIDRAIHDAMEAKIE